MAKEINFLKNPSKANLAKADVVINEAGVITFSKDYVTVAVVGEGKCVDLFVRKMQKGIKKNEAGEP
jgi:hypothetical protein